MKQKNIIFPIIITALAACGPGGGTRSEWDNIDYSSVYKKAQQRGEYDPSYVEPSGLCMDDDLDCH